MHGSSIRIIVRLPACPPANCNDHTQVLFTAKFRILIVTLCPAQKIANPANLIEDVLRR